MDTEKTDPLKEDPIKLEEVNVDIEKPEEKECCPCPKPKKPFSLSSFLGFTDDDKTDTKPETDTKTGTDAKPNSWFSWFYSSKNNPDTKPPALGENRMGGNHEKVIVIKLWAKWCGHCKDFDPVWKELLNHYSKNSNVIFEELEETVMKKNRNAAMNDLKKKYKNCIDEPQGFPTLYFFRSSNTIKQKPYNGKDRDFKTMKGIIDHLLMSIKKKHNLTSKGGAKRHKKNKTNRRKNHKI